MGMRETGIGDVNLGFKAIARDKPKERLAVGFSYSVKLPVASEEKGLGTGRVDHNLRAIFERQTGKFDLIFNAAYLNVGREMSDWRASGAQAIFRVDYNLTKKLEIQTEFFGNTVDEELPRAYTSSARSSIRSISVCASMSGHDPASGATLRQSEFSQDFRSASAMGFRKLKKQETSEMIKKSNGGNAHIRRPRNSQ